MFKKQNKTKQLWDKTQGTLSRTYHGGISLKYPPTTTASNKLPFSKFLFWKDSFPVNGCH